MPLLWQENKGGGVMNTTELIDLLKKHEFGGVTGRPREISFYANKLFIPDPKIRVKKKFKPK